MSPEITRWLVLLVGLQACTFDRSGAALPVAERDRPLADRSHEDWTPSDRLFAELSRVDRPRGDRAAADGPACIGGASASCWDVSGVFTKSDFERVPSELQIFGQVVTDNQRVYALLDGSQDSTYTTSTYNCGHFGKLVRAEAWDIERKVAGPTSFKLLVRGISDKDCGKPTPVCSGAIAVNPARGWKMSQPTACVVSSGINSVCKVDSTGAKLMWQAGSDCGGCCACPDGAEVDIEVLVSR